MAAADNDPCLDDSVFGIGCMAGHLVSSAGNDTVEGVTRSILSIWQLRPQPDR